MILLKAHYLVEKLFLPPTFFSGAELKGHYISKHELKRACNANEHDIDQFVAHMAVRGYLHQDAYIYSQILIKSCQEILSSVNQKIKPGISVSSQIAMKQAYIKLFTNFGRNDSKKGTFSSGLLPYFLEYPRLVQAETLAACTAKCSFCPYETLSRKGEKMPWSLLEKLAHEFEDFPVDFEFFFMPFKVSDPFLDDRLPDIASLVLNSHPLVKLSLTTNGFFMPQQKIDELLSVSRAHPGRISISISLNTVNPEEYKDLMKLDFNRTIENLDRIRDRRSEFVSNGINEVSVTRISTDHVGDVRFRSFSDDYLESSSSQDFFKFEIHNLNGWINHDAGEYSTKNSDASVASLFPCDEWQRISLLPNGDLSLCCMSHEASEDGLNFYNHTLKEMHAAKIQKYVPLDRKGQKILGRKYSASPCTNCDFNKRSPVNKAFDLLVQQPLALN